MENQLSHKLKMLQTSITRYLQHFHYFLLFFINKAKFYLSESFSNTKTTLLKSAAALITFLNGS